MNKCTSVFDSGLTISINDGVRDRPIFDKPSVYKDCLQPFDWPFIRESSDEPSHDNPSDLFLHLYQVRTVAIDLK
jgi:hypothetical protein